MHATVGTIGHKPEAANFLLRVGSSVATASAGAFHTVVVLREGAKCALATTATVSRGAVFGTVRTRAPL